MRAARRRAEWPFSALTGRMWPICVASAAAKCKCTRRAFAASVHGCNNCGFRRRANTVSKYLHLQATSVSGRETVCCGCEQTRVMRIGRSIRMTNPVLLAFCSLCAARPKGRTHCTAECVPRAAMEAHHLHHLHLLHLQAECSSPLAILCVPNLELRANNNNNNNQLAELANWTNWAN